MNGVKIFEKEEFGKIRTAGTCEEPLFCLADVCRVLEIGNVSDVKNRLKQDGVVLIEVTDALGRLQNTYFVKEQNLYRVIMRSDKPNAEAFQDWVCGEVLPSIRKTGSYGLPKTFAEALRLAADQQERIEAQDRIIREQTPKADYFDNLVERNLLTNFRDTAKQIGLKQNDFIKRLIRDKYIYRDKKNTIKPYSKFVDELFEIKDWGVDGKAGLQTLITPKGKETFRLLYSNMPMPLM